MQRVPTRQRQSVPNVNAAKRPQSGEASPFLRIARRIREEQGVEQLRAFLAAMVPFVAPNELKSVCSGFGLDYDSILSLKNEQSMRPPARSSRDNPGFGTAGFGNMGAMSPTGAMNGMNPFGAAGGQMQLLQMLMSMQNMMKGGKGDISRIMSMMNGR